MVSANGATITTVVNTAGATGTQNGAATAGSMSGPYQCWGDSISQIYIADASEK